MENIYPNLNIGADRKSKQLLLNQKSAVFWLTGLSGSGKTTVAIAAEKTLSKLGYLVQILDGDNIRSGISKNLGFSLEDRKENIRRISEVSKLFVESGIICINCFVSPTREIRALAKNTIGEEDFYEVYISTSLKVCENRDVKGLYARARSGQIKNFTGIDSPFESPEFPTLIINTHKKSIEQSADMLVDFVLKKVN